MNAPKRVWLVMPTLNRYQSARYEAFAGRKGDTGVFEIAGGGSYPIPGWRSPTADMLQGVVTLFQGLKYGEISASELRKRLEMELNNRRDEISAVAVLGWEDAAALTVIRWASAHKVPIIILSESNAFDAPRHWLKEWIKQRIVRLCAAGLAGGSCAASYLAQLGLSKDKILLGYDAVDNEFFAKKAEEVRGQRSESRSKHGLPEHFFLASGRFVEKKNLPRLLQAYARYRALCASPLRLERGEGRGEGSSPSSAQPWNLVLLGDGPLKPDLCRLISDLSLQDSVLLPGAKAYEDLPTYYGLASAFVHASVVEQWGLVVNEAMASALPVLVSNRCGCAPDLVQEGVNGFTFNPLDIEQLATLLSKLSNLNSQLSSFGSASREIISRWSPEVFGRNLRRAAAIALSAQAPSAGCIDPILIAGMLALNR